MQKMLESKKEGGSMSLPDLSKWHEVPVGAYIDAGTPYVAAPKGAENHFEYKVFSLSIKVAENDTHIFYTEKPVERLLADVLRDAYLADEDWDNVAIVAQQWFAKQQQPETYRDADGDYWHRAKDGTWAIQERDGQVDYVGYSYDEMVRFAGRWGE